MPTFFERLQELKNSEPELSMDEIEIIKKYYDCIYEMLDMLKNNPIFMSIAHQANLYEPLLERFNDTEKLLNQYHHNQISNKRN